MTPSTYLTLLLTLLQPIDSPAPKNGQSCMQAPPVCFSL